MWKPRHSLEFFLLCLTVSFFTWLLPEGYNLEQKYRIKGELDSQKNLVSALQKNAGLHHQTRVPNCRIAPSREVRCKILATTRSERKSLSTWLASDLPSTLGWVNRTVIQKRATLTEKNLNDLQQEKQTLVNSLEKARLTAENDEKVLREAQLIVEDLRKQLSNRESQVELLSQAISQKKEAQQEYTIFEKKRQDVALRIQEIQSEIREAERFLAEVGEPYERRKKEELRLASVTQEMEAQQFALATWSSALLTHANQTRMPDPDSFQLALLNPQPQIKPKRSLISLLWAPILALLLYGWIRPLQLPQKISEAFQDAKEVEKSTGWPCLGRL